MFEIIRNLTVLSLTHCTYVRASFIQVAACLNAKEVYVIRSRTYLSTHLVEWHQSMLHVRQQSFYKLLLCGLIILKHNVWVKSFYK